MARNTYTPEFKTKLVLEVIKETKALEDIASENNINPNMLRTWRKDFLENASSIFEKKDTAEKENKRKEADLEKKNTKMLKTIGQLTLERDFLQDCFRRCGLPVPEYDTDRK